MRFSNPPDNGNTGARRRLLATWASSFFCHLLVMILLACFVSVGATSDQMVLRFTPKNSEVILQNEFELLAPATELDEPIVEELPMEQLQTKMELVPIEQPLPPEVQESAPVATEDREFIFARSVSSRAMVANAEFPTSDAMVASVEKEEAFDFEKIELGGRAERRIRYSSPRSDYAIDQGLLWLARHQWKDGGWGFEHRVGECRGRCPNAGSKRGARVAATGLALLPFLGAGHSPENGEHREVVTRGISFLLANMSRHGSLCHPEGQMYGHGIATLALCECYGILSQAPPKPGLVTSRPVDLEELRRASEAAIAFIVKAQGVDGGWRYFPGQRGDTSVVGWQVMALKSARDAGLGTNQETFDGAESFLDMVQIESAGDPDYGMVGIRYAYLPSRRITTDATTAIGLACRIYMGVSPFHPGMEVAVKRIADHGPIRGNMYYNIYANQVLFQHGGQEWASWRQRLEEELVRTQEVAGHLEGSWYFGHVDHGGGAGGRLYATAMSCLCLEETFRHLPIFRKNAQVRFLDGLNQKNHFDAKSAAKPMGASPIGDKQPKLP